MKAKASARTARRPTARSRSAKKRAKVEEQEARLNVTLPDSLHQAVKVEAAKRRQTIRALIIELLKKEGIA